MTETTTEIFLPLEQLLEQFHADVETAALNPEIVYAAVAQLNPNFKPACYSESPPANLKANIVAGIYAPVIHAFAHTVLKNVSQGKLPHTLLLPPRDTIPIAYSLDTLSRQNNIPVKLKTPPLNRIVAGIANNQLHSKAVKDPLFDSMISQHFGDSHEPVAEIETGIYGTTTIALAESLAHNGINQPVIPVKMYGLGPNLSFVHALLSEGKIWQADTADADLQQQVLDLMVFIDSLEEYGMQNKYKSIAQLQKLDDGYIVPLLEPVSDTDMETAQATNLAIVATASEYDYACAQATALGIFRNFKQAMLFANQGLPLCLKAAVPPMDNKQQHFANLNNEIAAGRIALPQLCL